MATSLDVARYLIRLAAQDPESEGLTQMRLHKLLYYVQGWSLAFRRRPMFDSPIEAWVHGPVVKDIYREFREFGNQPIPDSVSPIRLNDSDQQVIKSIWLGYRRFSAAGLRRKTHRETPWINARKGCDSEEHSRQPIQHDDLQQFFTAESLRHRPPGMPLELLTIAEQEFQSGKGIPLSTVVSEE